MCGQKCFSQNKVFRRGYFYVVVITLDDRDLTINPFHKGSIISADETVPCSFVMGCSYDAETELLRCLGLPESLSRRGVDNNAVSDRFDGVFGWHGH